MVLPYKVLVQRLREAETPGTKKYRELLEFLAEIPGYTKTEEYKIFYNLICEYQSAQTRLYILEEYLDETIHAHEDFINSNPTDK